MTKTYNTMFHTSSSWKKTKLFELVTVTPDLANDLLRLNTQNRPVKSVVLNRYISDMKAGKFVFSGDAIKISKEGVLLDGQHRLLAVVSSGISIQTHIQSGLDPAVFTVLDTGSPRTISDIMALKNYKYYSSVAPVARIIRAIEKGLTVSNTDGTLANRKNDAQLALVQSMDKDLLEESCKVAHEFRARHKLVELSLLAAMYYVLSTKGRGSEAKTFLDLLSLGDGLGSTTNSSIWLLRNRLIDNLSSSTKLTLNAKYFLLVSCWNHFIKNRSMKRLPKITDEPVELNF
jgi:hypothetical protein